jgi:hypothetical protein
LKASILYRIASVLLLLSAAGHSVGDLFRSILGPLNPLHRERARKRFVGNVESFDEKLFFATNIGTL